MNICDILQRAEDEAEPLDRRRLALSLAHQSIGLMNESERYRYHSIAHQIRQKLFALTSVFL